LTVFRPLRARHLASKRYWPAPGTAGAGKGTAHVMIADIREFLMKETESRASNSPDSFFRSEMFKFGRSFDLI
jgi:hypothetical protein